MRVVCWWVLSYVVGLVAQSTLPGSPVDPLLHSVSAFNIQVFGLSKVNNAQVAPRLVQILNNFDLSAIIEIRDSSETAFPTLVRMTNAARTDGRRYNFVVGPREGRSSSKEQYGLMFLPDRFQVKNYYGDSDPQNVFERPPLVAHVAALDEAGNVALEFIAIVIHTQPSSATTYLEVNELQRVYEDARKVYKTDNALIMGDFNSACSYLPRYRWPQVTLRTNTTFLWLISDSVDTTTGVNNACAYDRFVLTGAGAIRKYVNGSAGVFDFRSILGLTQQQTQAVSDHFPIFLHFDIPNRIGPRHDTSDPNDVDGNGPRGFPVYATVLIAVAVIALFVGVLVVWGVRTGRLRKPNFSKPARDGSYVSPPLPTSPPPSQVKRLKEMFEAGL